MLYIIIAIAGICFVVRWLFLRTDFIYALVRRGRWMEDCFHVYQSFKIPEFNETKQENQLHRKVSNYVNSLSSIEDSDFTNLLSGKKHNQILIEPEQNQIVEDTFLGSRITWIKESTSFVLKIRRKDKRRILQPYLQYIHTVSDEIDEKRKDLKLYMNIGDDDGNGRWRSIQFTHPTTLDSIAMESDLKNKLKSDLETFLKSKQYYHRLGRVWKRSYLLCGPSGTGKSSFIAAMANYLNYNVYDLDLSIVSRSSDLKSLLLQTTSRSIVVVEDLDRFLIEKSSSSAEDVSGILNFMDGILSSCVGEGRVMIYTISMSKEFIDSAILRPGRVDVHVNFPLCDFSSFKFLASNYLGVKEHKLFPHVEEMFMTGASLSPAEVGEIMIVNRNSPSRAIKSVISALQISGDAKRMSDTESRDVSVELSCGTRKEGGGEFRKLYDFLRMRNCKKSGPLDVINANIKE